MKFSIWTFATLILLALPACQLGNSTPTATIIAPEKISVNTPSESRVDDTPPTATRLPYPSPTPTRTPLIVPQTQPAATPTSTTVTTTLTQAEIVVSSLNVREGPGVDYPAVGVAYAGDILEITGTSNSHWIQVMTAPNESGWISGQPAYTKISGSLADIPLVEIAPPVAKVSEQSDRGNGKLIFTTGSGGDLFAANIDGTDLKHLAGGVIDPAVSPNGQQVAFTRWDGGEMGTVHVIDVDGSNERAILGDTLQAKSPTWSPDGEEIIVSFQHGGLRNPPRECEDFFPWEPVRIPERINIISTHVSKRTGIITICFYRKEDLHWGLRKVNVATGQNIDLPADTYSYNPAWDPQNPWRVIYSGRDGLIQLDVANQTYQLFTNDLRDNDPVFSPDGKTLALTYKQHDHWEIYTLDLVTGQRQRITKPPLLADPQYSSASPAWSPDGKQIIFVTDRTAQWEIWAMNADGSNQRSLFLPEMQTELGLQYWGMNERMLNWVE